MDSPKELSLSFGLGVLLTLTSSLGLILVNLEDATIDLGWYTNLDVGKTL